MSHLKRTASQPPLGRPPSKFRGSRGNFESEPDGLQDNSSMASADNPHCTMEAAIQPYIGMDDSLDHFDFHNWSVVETVSPLEIICQPQKQSDIQGLNLTQTEQNPFMDFEKVSETINNAEHEHNRVSSEKIAAKHRAGTKDSDCGEKKHYLDGLCAQASGIFDQSSSMDMGFDNRLIDGFDMTSNLWAPNIVDSTSTNVVDTGSLDNIFSCAEITNSIFTASDNQPPLLTSPIKDHSLNLQNSQNSGNSKACIRSALTILQALHIPSKTCFWTCDKDCIANPRQSRMLDDVLSSNRDIVRMISDMLKCTCSLALQTQLILTTICGRVIDWYRAILRENERSNPPFMTESAHVDKTNKDDQVENVLHQPVQIGHFSFDGILQSEIWAQVIISELQHLEVLVDQLRKRIQGERSDTTTSCPLASATEQACYESSGPDETARIESTRRNLGSFLRNQMQVVKEETISSTGNRQFNA